MLTFQEFLHGNFHNIAIDQAHEQNNECVKGSGRAIGPTQNLATLQ